MPGEHALLSPSGAERWLNCPPSARLEETMPDDSGPAASEGTLAHLLSETILKYKTGIIAKNEFDKAFDDIKNDEQYENAMYEYCDQYATFILESWAEAEAISPGALLFLEQKLDLSRYIEKGFGTSDAVIISAKTLIINDLKYGRGVVVYADENKQMKVYALGALEKFGFLYEDIETVRMVIYQPRVDNYSTFEMSVTDLLAWGESELIPGAALAYAGEGEFKAGKHCNFCKVRAKCRANAAYNLEIAKHEFELPVFLMDDEISDILNRSSVFTKWISSVEEYALKEAIHNGKKWPDYKLVEGRSNRVFTSVEAVATKLLAKGYPEETIYEPKKLYGITMLEKEIGKKIIAEELAPLIIKPPGKLALVHVNDKRPEYNSLDAAKRDFEGFGDEPDLNELG